MLSPKLGVMVRVPDDATCEKIGFIIGFCIPFVGFITFCISGRSRGTAKSKWARYACGSGAVGVLLSIIAASRGAA